MPESWIASWGYLAIGIGTVLEGETIVLVGAALAHAGSLDVRGVALAAFLGSLLGDQGWYWIGRRFGARMLASRPAWSARASRVTAKIGRWGDAYVIAFRFLYGLRTISPLVLGATRFSPRRFVPLNALGAALWAIATSAIGWSLGSALHRMLGRLARIEELLAIAAGLAIVLALVRAISRIARSRDSAGRHREQRPSQERRGAHGSSGS